MLDFPNSPTPGQVFQAGNASWVWDGAKWTQAGSTTGYLPLTGGNLTGNLNVVPSVGYGGIVIAGGTNGDALLNLNKSASGQVSYIVGNKAGSPRWTMSLGDSAAESSGNAGSNFAIDSYADNGAYLGVSLTINRASGAASFSGVVAAIGSVNLQALNTGSNAIFATFDGNNRAVARMYTTAVAGYAYWDNAAASPFAQLVIDPGGNFLYSGGTGAAFKIGGGSWTAASDARIKTVLSDYPLGLDEIIKIQPVRYVYKGNDTMGENISAPLGAPVEGVELRDTPHAPYRNSPHAQVAESQKVFTGFVADDLMRVFPDMVSQRNGFIDGRRVNDLKDVDTSELIYALVNAVKTLSARIETLEGR